VDVREDSETEYTSTWCLYAASCDCSVLQLNEKSSSLLYLNLLKHFLLSICITDTELTLLECHYIDCQKAVDLCVMFEFRIVKTFNVLQMLTI
jgi:hypothetical protein